MDGKSRATGHLRSRDGALSRFGRPAQSELLDACFWARDARRHREKKLPPEPANGCFVKAEQTNEMWDRLSTSRRRDGSRMPGTVRVAAAGAAQPVRVTGNSMSIFDDLPLYSELAADPLLRPMVELFVHEMPARTAILRANFETGNWDALRRGPSNEGCGGQLWLRPANAAIRTTRRGRDPGGAG